MMIFIRTGLGSYCDYITLSPHNIDNILVSSEIQFSAYLDPADANLESMSSSALFMPYWNRIARIQTDEC